MWNPTSPCRPLSLEAHPLLVWNSRELCAPLEGGLAAAADLVRLLMVLEGVEWEAVCVCASLCSGRARLIKASTNFTPSQTEPWSGLINNNNYALHTSSSWLWTFWHCYVMNPPNTAAKKERCIYPMIMGHRVRVSFLPSMLWPSGIALRVPISSPEPWKAHVEHHCSGT